MTTKRYADVALAGGGVLSLAALSWFFYQFAWTGQRIFEGSLAAAIHYIGLASLSFLFFASLRFRPALKLCLVAVCLTAVALAYPVEIFLAHSKAQLRGAPFWGMDRASLEHKQVVAELAKE